MSDESMTRCRSQWTEISNAKQEKRTEIDTVWKQKRPGRDPPGQLASTAKLLQKVISRTQGTPLKPRQTERRVMRCAKEREEAVYDDGRGGEGFCQKGRRRLHVRGQTDSDAGGRLRTSGCT